MPAFPANEVFTRNNFMFNFGFENGITFEQWKNEKIARIQLYQMEKYIIS